MTGPGHRQVYAVGHSNRSLEGLLGVLHQAEVRAVVDVRRYPFSRRHPQFNRDELSTALLKGGVVYHHLGDTLGGYRSGSYETYLLNDHFQAGLGTLEELAASTSTAILCAERDPALCHRRFIADCLAERGWEVVHLLDLDASAPHRLSPSQRRLF